MGRELGMEKDERKTKNRTELAITRKKNLPFELEQIPQPFY